MQEYECAVKLHDEEDEYTIEYFTFSVESNLTAKQLLDVFHEQVLLRYGDYIEFGLEKL